MMYKEQSFGGTMMKKTLWVLLLAALLLLAGCGTDEKQEPTERPLVEVQIPYETV